jgi:hypothetical protein
MQRKTLIHAEYSDEVEEAIERFGDHEAMSQARLLRWLDQFSDEAMPLAIEVVKAVRYYGTANIRAMTKQLFQMITAEFASKGLTSAVFVAVGGSGSGSATVIRVLRELVRGTPHKVVTMLDVAQIQPGSLDAIAFIDDFSGTGNTLVSWWETVEPTVRPSNAAIFVGLLILNESARPRIEEFADVLSVTELDENANVFAAGSTLFSEEQRLQLIDYCRRTQCGTEYERGYGSCGLLIAFKHGCPNNSLPILWCDNDKWRSLFNRRGI